MIRILGEGGFAREVEQHLLPKFFSFLVDSRNAYADDHRPTLIAIGSPKIREAIDYDFEKMSTTWFSWPGNMTHINRADGLIVCPGAQVTTNVKFGRHVHVNLNATIGHDCVIGDYVTISPGANISGNVTIGKRCYIGTGAVIIEKITLCDDVVLGAGAVVVKDITEPGTYVGCPAKRIK